MSELVANTWLVPDFSEIDFRRSALSSPQSSLLLLVKLASPAFIQGDHWLYWSDCHALMKCQLPVAVPGRIQLNPNALPSTFTTNGPIVHSMGCVSFSQTDLFPVPTALVSPALGLVLCPKLRA